MLIASNLQIRDAAKSRYAEDLFFVVEFWPEILDFVTFPIFMAATL